MIETVLTEYIDNIVDSPGSQFKSWRRKHGGGESPPGSTRSLHDLSGVKVGPPSPHSPSDKQDLDHEYEVLLS